jgi:RNA polymerase sigma factor (sigma-70 family)
MIISQNKYYSDLWDKFISQNSQEALSTIYVDHYNRLFKFGLRYTSDKQIVENAIQNVFSYFLKIRKKLGPVNTISGYLIQSFRRQLYLELKKQKKIVLYETFSEGDFNYYNAQEQKEDLDGRDQMLQIVRRIISTLRPKQQEIIYLRFNCNLSYEEISSMLDISVDSCYKSVCRSVKAIRSEALRIFPAKDKGNSSGSFIEQIILFFFSNRKFASEYLK